MLSLFKQKSYMIPLIPLIRKQILVFAFMSFPCKFYFYCVSVCYKNVMINCHHHQSSMHCIKDVTFFRVNCIAHSICYDFIYSKFYPSLSLYNLRMRQVNFFATMHRLRLHGWSTSNNEPVKSASEYDQISLVGPDLRFDHLKMT